MWAERTNKHLVRILFDSLAALGITNTYRQLGTVTNKYCFTLYTIVFRQPTFCQQFSNNGISGKDLKFY
ncbi:hypothetical protein BU23DRAFT_554240 [Bimuria novae-zelandiae CBS 107.79]|uniref:Uncharacterized protein n=1 Tax=Bimuria novae-zelandiae CBS 107.79 TaxID=1447943 RepID=A0A6A5V9C2_9PLEO|nr:hypothetical protein BU23DRAFT_554240 [Bimuria novae-zelandiae CBS 107.79]